MKRTFISAAAILAFAASAHADELTDIQAQAKQLREQNAAMTKRLVDIEKRQKALEAQKTAVPTINPVDAMAADLPYKAAVKAKPVENDDICVKGICVYGNFDMGISYKQHGSPFNGVCRRSVAVHGRKGLQWLVLRRRGQPDEHLVHRSARQAGNRRQPLRRVQLADPVQPGLRHERQRYGRPRAEQWSRSVRRCSAQANSYGNSSKGGQMFNNAAYFGVSSPTYGTFTMGRQSALSSDLVGNYDALSGANAWSMITFEGATGGGGVTENRIYDNSYEYRLNIGPVRLAAEAQLRNGGNSSTGNAFEGNIGFDYMGFSMDFVGGKIYDANSVGTTLSTAQVNALTGNQVGTVVNPFGGAIPCSLGCMSGTISDNTVFQVAASLHDRPLEVLRRI